MVKIENSKCRYLIVDAKDVVNYPYKALSDYFVKRDRPFINLEEIFEYYEIPTKYQKFIIRMNPFFSKYECQEYFKKMPFDFTGYTRFKKGDSDRVIVGRTISDSLTNFVEFRTPMVFKTYDEVVNFAFDIIDEELLLKYEMALSTIFSISFDYDNISVLNKYRRVKKK